MATVVQNKGGANLLTEGLNRQKKCSSHMSVGHALSENNLKLGIEASDA